MFLANFIHRHLIFFLKFSHIFKVDHLRIEQICKHLVQIFLVHFPSANFFKCFIGVAVLLLYHMSFKIAEHA